MEIFCTLLLFLAITLNYIELSLQSERMPDGGPNSGSHRRRSFSSSAASRHSSETIHPLTTPGSSASSSSRLRERSRSPPLKQTFPSVLGFSFEDLASIRLVPHDHPNRVFELQTYVFPPDKKIGLKSRYRDLNLISGKEKIVLSTSNGDVCAILEKKVTRDTNIRAIYTSVSGRSVRVKININSGTIEKLTVDEIMECPPTAHGEIVKSYGVLEFKNTTHSIVNPLHPSTSSTPAEPGLSDPSDPSALKETFPRVLGYSFEELPFIRLASLTHPNRILELRTYIFPPDKPLRLRTKIRVLIPMPTEQQIVLSTPEGDICAILEKTPSRHTNIRPIFTPIFGMAERAKINMNSGVVGEMNAEEIEECPVSSSKKIANIYTVFRV